MAAVAGGGSGGGSGGSRRRAAAAAGAGGDGVKAGRCMHGIVSRVPYCKLPTTTAAAVPRENTHLCLSQLAYPSHYASQKSTLNSESTMIEPRNDSDSKCGKGTCAQHVAHARSSATHRSTLPFLLSSSLDPGSSHSLILRTCWDTSVPPHRQFLQPLGGTERTGNGTARLRQ